MNGVPKKYVYSYFGVYHNGSIYYLACNPEIGVTKHNVNNEKLDYRRLSNTKVRSSLKQCFSQCSDLNNLNSTKFSDTFSNDIQSNLTSAKIWPSKNCET